MLSVPKEDRVADPPTQDIPSPLKDKKLNFRFIVVFHLQCYSLQKWVTMLCNFAVLVHSLMRVIE